MKTVDLETLKQQLKEARNGGRKQQKAFLSSINYHSTNGIVINEMNDSDLLWIAPLALELFVPAVNIVACGMRQKCRHWEEDFLDDDTGETVTVLRIRFISRNVGAKRARCAIWTRHPVFFDSASSSSACC